MVEKFDYDEMQEVAEELLEEFGFIAQLIDTSSITPDPEDPPYNPSPATPDLLDVEIVETGYKLTNRNETLVQVGDKLGIISTRTGNVPNKQQQLKIDGEVWYFKDLQPLRTGGQNLLYEFHARQ